MILTSASVFVNIEVAESHEYKAWLASSSLGLARRRFRNDEICA